ncbi:leucine-rich repeat-containing protein 63 isoform X2 [Danio rerio]
MWCGDVLLLRRPRAPKHTLPRRRSPQRPRDTGPGEVCESPDLQHRVAVAPVRLPRMPQGFSQHAQRVDVCDLLPAADTHTLRKTILSRHNYRKLLHLFLSELHSGGQSTVANQTLSCEHLPPITRRIPRRQIICELAAVVQMEARARNPFRICSGDQTERRSEHTHTHTHSELFTAPELLLTAVSSRLFQGCARSASPFHSAGVCEVISVCELAVLECVTRGGTTLSLKAHFVSDLPDVSCVCERLQHLNLSFNFFTHIPQQVWELKQLKVLKMRSNPLEELPANISRLKNLHTLVLSFCKITQLPAELFSLPCLQYLDVSYNLLRSLSSDIGTLRSLRYLNVEGNQLVCVPAALLSVCVSELRLSGNYTHTLLWRENSCNSPQTLLHTAAHTLTHTLTAQRHTHLLPIAQTILQSAGVCEACSGPMFGPGLQILVPVCSVFGLQVLPVMFRCCSPVCVRTFRRHTHTTSARGTPQKKKIKP